MRVEQIIYELIKYLNCVFEVFLYYYFFESLFSLYEERKNYIVTEIIIAASIIYVINIFQIPLGNLLSALLIFVCFSWLLFHKSPRNTLPYIVLFIVIFSLIEFIFHYIYRLTGIDYQEPGIKRVLLLLVQGVFRFLIVEILRKNNGEIWAKGESICDYLKLLFILPIATIILLNGVLYVEHFPLGYGLICLGGILLIVSNIGGFFIVGKILEVINSMNEAKLTIIKTELEKNHYQRIEEINQEYAKYAHEIRKAARTVQQLAEQGENREISQIAVQLQKSGAAFSNKIYCSDVLVNAILLERHKIAEQRNVEFSVQIQPGIDYSFIDELDRIILFGNLFDNAIEAASKTKKGYMRIDIYMGNQTLIICRVENNFTMLPKKKGFEYLSTKKEKGHGYGIKNVKEVAEKYGGILNLEEEQPRFVAVLVLSNMPKNGKLRVSAK